jgi:hypothetical protein
MANERQSVIPNSGPDVDAAAYAIGRNHADMKPLGTIKGKTGLGHRGADQPKESPNYPTHRG